MAEVETATDEWPLPKDSSDSLWKMTLLTLLNAVGVLLMSLVLYYLGSLDLTTSSADVEPEVSMMATVVVCILFIGTVQILATLVLPLLVRLYEKYRPDRFLQRVITRLAGQDPSTTVNQATPRALIIPLSQFAIVLLSIYILSQTTIDMMDNQLVQIAYIIVFLYVVTLLRYIVKIGRDSQHRR